MAQKSQTCLKASVESVLEDVKMSVAAPPVGTGWTNWLFVVVFRSSSDQQMKSMLFVVIIPDVDCVC